MKKTLILCAALCSSVYASSDVLTLAEQWDFTDSLTSSMGNTFSTQSVKVAYDDGFAIITSDDASDTSLNGSGGIFMSTGLGFGTKDWAVQFFFKAPGYAKNSESAQTIVCTDNGSSNGAQLAVTNLADSAVDEYVVFGSSWNAAGWGNRTSVGLPIAGEDKVTALTLLNYGGTLYIAENENWAATTFGGTADGVTLDKLMFGFGRNGQYGLATAPLMLDKVSIFTFDSATASLEDVKSAAVPEPATATLSLLALTGLVARRKRH